MKLTETSTLWGNAYHRRYYLDGVRITETHAGYLLKNHAWEDGGCDRKAGAHKTHWLIGPRLDAASMTNRPDCI
jgi:hypothetical protein